MNILPDPRKFVESGTSQDKLLRGVKSGELVAHAPMDGAVFARVCKGLEESRLTPIKFLVFYRNATARG